MSTLNLSRSEMSSVSASCVGGHIASCHPLHCPFTSNSLSKLKFDAAKQASNFEALLAAGIREDFSKNPDKSGTVKRLLEGLASTLAPLDADVQKLDSTDAILKFAHNFSTEERKEADIPLFHVPVVPAKLSHRDNMLKELVLDTLGAFVEAVQQHPDVLSAESAVAAADEIGRMLATVAPASLFSELSPATLPPERTLCTDVLDARRAHASGCASKTSAAGALTNGLRLEAAKAVVPSLASGWKCDDSGTPIWGVSFPAPTAVSSMKIYWAVSNWCLYCQSFALKINFLEIAECCPANFCCGSYQRSYPGSVVARNAHLHPSA
jgi:hypothetical protein